jgi:hypothetical protein
LPTVCPPCAPWIAILVLQQGRIIEEGNHRTLMRRSGHYAELYDTYFRHQSPDYDFRNRGSKLKLL